MQSDDKPAGGETVPTDSGSPVVPQRDSTTQWGKNFLRVRLDEGTTACSFCGTPNPTASQFTESLRQAIRTADAENCPKLTKENLLEMDHDTSLPLGKIDEDDRTEYSYRSTDSTTPTVFDSVNARPANQEASSEAKTLRNGPKRGAGLQA